MDCQIICCLLRKQILPFDYLGFDLLRNALYPAQLVEIHQMEYVFSVIYEEQRVNLFSETKYVVNNLWTLTFERSFDNIWYNVEIFKHKYKYYGPP